jgi:hypothetical protein
MERTTDMGEGGVSLFDVAQVCSRNERETNGSRRSPTQRVAGATSLFSNLPLMSKSDSD